MNSIGQLIYSQIGYQNGKSILNLLMCLPLTFLKYSISIQAYITLALGLIAFGVSIYIDIHAKPVFEFFQSYDVDIGRPLMIILWVFDSVLVFLAICGIIGGYKKICCLLAIFNIGNFVGLVVFFILGVLAFMVAIGIDSLNVCPTTVDTKMPSWSSSLQQTYELGSSMLCQVGQCECYIPISSPQHYNPLLPYQGISNALAQNAQSCTQFPSSNSVNALFLDSIETSYDCAGWCPQQNNVPYTYYVFSYVYETVPLSGQQGCYKQTIGSISDRANGMGGLCMFIAFTLFVFTILTCCLCCHKDRPKEQSFFAQMAQMDEQNEQEVKLTEGFRS